jgi:hypothetical protein
MYHARSNLVPKIKQLLGVFPQTYPPYVGIFTLVDGKFSPTADLLAIVVMRLRKNLVPQYCKISLVTFLVVV